MGQLRLAKQMDLEAFPGCAAVVDDTPGEAQCQETEISGATGTTTLNGDTLTDVGAFVGIDPAGKILTITAPVANVGDYTILSNTDDVLTLATTTPEASAVNVYTVHDTAQTYLTRSEASFIRFIENLGNAHTTINGQLYTDVLTGPLANACSDTYAPD